MSQASRDIMAEYTVSSESYLSVSEDDETAATLETECSLYHDPEFHDDGQTNETDKGVCSADENNGDNKASKNYARVEERSNEIGKKGGEIEKAGEGHGDAFGFKAGVEDEEGDTEDEEEDTEDDEEKTAAEKEKERLQGHGSELQTTDVVRKPVEVREDLALLDTTEAGSKQQEVRANGRLNQAKRIPLLGTRNNKRRVSTNSVLGKKRRKIDTTILALLNKSQFNSNHKPSSDLQKGQIKNLWISQGDLRCNRGGAQGTEKQTERPSASKPSRQQSTIRLPERYYHIIKEAKDDQVSRDNKNKPETFKPSRKRQFREDCRDILDSIFRTMWDLKSQFISLTDSPSSYSVVDHVDAARNLEPIIDVIKDNEINYILAAMLRVVNQVFLMRTIEVACAETIGSVHHAQSTILKRIASHL